MYSISVVTPTLDRPDDVRELLTSLARQTYLPAEVILVDGAPPSNRETEQVVAEIADSLPFRCVHTRENGGTATQRNFGIELATGNLLAFVDDDVRPARDFLHVMVDALAADHDRMIGGIVGCRVNHHFRPEDRARWRWYRRLHLLHTFEPGRYDFACGYPVNANMQAPFSGLRGVDFMTTSCAVWRREVFDAGLRFDPFFRDYGVLEDAHFSLRAGREWQLRVCGDAHCEHRQSARGRVSRRRIGFKSVVNYYYVFSDIAGPLSRAQKARFWRFQGFELFRIATSSIRRRRMDDVAELIGRMEGIVAVARGVLKAPLGRSRRNARAPAQAVSRIVLVLHEAAAALGDVTHVAH